MIEWFWLALVTGTLGWFASVTGIVAVKGCRDIREMLRQLSSEQDRDTAKDSSDP